jgi:murein DD-endopeptidase MepM/ murein hydrolase activator NlpD
MTVPPTQTRIATGLLQLQRSVRRRLVPVGAVAVLVALVATLLPIVSPPVIAAPSQDDPPSGRSMSPTATQPGDGDAPTDDEVVLSSAPVVPLAAVPVQGPCTYTDTWGAPRSGGRRHEGVDVIAKSGQYVYAVANGRLSKQAADRPGSLSGNAWWLTTSDGTYYFYAHLSGFAPGLKVGSQVVAGQIIGYIGMTGNAGAPHLHFEIHPGGGSAVNPTPSVRAVDACRTTAPLPQPGETPPTTTPSPGPVPPRENITGDSSARRQFISPVKAFDSAWGSGRLVGERSVRVSGLWSVGNAPGVLTRLTASGAPAAGHLLVHPCNTPGTGVASLTFPASGTAIGTAPVTVTDGTICVTTNTPVNLKLEIIAVRTPSGSGGAGSSTGVGLRPIPAHRALDTRTTVRLTPGTQTTIDATTLGVTPGTQALSATISIVDPAAAGTLTLGLCGAGSWTVPTNRDRLSSFAIVMRVTTTGWCLSSTVATDVIVDITGIWTGTTGPVPIPTTRVLDTRTPDGGNTPIGPTGRTIQITGRGTIPTGTTAVILAVTTISTDHEAIVFATPCGQPRGTGVITATNPHRITTVIAPTALAPDGTLCITTIHPTHLVIDVLAAG